MILVAELHTLSRVGINITACCLNGSKFQFLFNVTFLVTVYIHEGTYRNSTCKYIHKQQILIPYIQSDVNQTKHISQSNDVMMKINLPTSPLLGIFTFPTP